MATDEERLEVARRLRAIEPDDFGSYSEEHECVEKILGTWDDCDKFLWRVVADLIEPPLQCPHFHSDRHFCSVHGDLLEIDRDALLELADEFDEQAEFVARYIESSDGDFDRRAIDAMEGQYEYARRIRKALGVER